MDLVQKMIETAKSPSSSSTLAREGRDLDIFGFPVLHVIGAIILAYLILYILSVYIGPLIFGTRPYYYYYPRSIPMGVSNFRPFTGPIPMNSEEAQRLTRQVTQAIRQ